MKEFENEIILDTYLSPYFPETESLFEDSIVVMVDIFRSSTTIAAALYNGAKDIIPCDSLDKAVRIYSSINKEIRYLGGERNGTKPSGFDAGNSPFEYSEENIKGKSIVFTTSNGTVTFLKAKLARCRIIAGFVNHTAIVNFILEEIGKIIADDKQPKIYILNSGTNGRLSFEDIYYSGYLINSLTKKANIKFFTDSCYVALNIYENNNIDSLKDKQHAKKLIELGYKDDIDISLKEDIFPVVPILIDSVIKKL